MKISRVRIRGFGKFENEEISFGKGLNVIYGPNESGKTTLASFILYTLSGFSPDEIERYRPWSGIEMGGELVVETEEGTTTVDLDPENPSSERLLSREEFEVSSYIPEEGGLEVFSGVSGVVVARLRKRMEKMEKVEKIIQLLKSEQDIYEKLSEREKEIKGKLEKLEDEIDELLKKLEEEKALRRRYVESKKKLEKLRKDLGKLKDELLAAKIVKARKVWKEMDELRLKISSLGVEISNLKKFTRYPQEKIDRIWEIKKEIDEIDRKLNSLKQDLAKREEELKVLEQRKMVLEEILKVSEGEDIDKVMLKVKNLELSLKMLEEKKRPKGFDERWRFFESILDVDERIDHFREVNERLERTEKSLEEMERELENTERDLSDIRSKMGVRNTLTLIFLVLAGGLIAGGYLTGLLFYLSIAAAVSTGLALALFLSTGELRRARSNLEGEIERLKVNIEVLSKKAESLKEEIESFLKRSGFSSPRELISEYERYLKWKESVKDQVKSDDVRLVEEEIREGLKEFFEEVEGDYSSLISELKEKASEYAILREKVSSLRLSIEGTKAAIDELVRKKESLIEERDSLFEEMGCEDYSGCKEIELKREQHDRLVEEREKLEERMSELKEIWKELKNYHDLEIPEGIDTEKLDSIEVISTRIESTEMEISELETRMKELLEDIEKAKVNLKEIREKIGEKRRLELQHGMIEEEMKIFPEVTKLFSEIKDEFVGKYKGIFEKKFKEYSEKIIGKSFEVEVGEDLSLSIKSAEGGAERLSRATRDQVELSYKLALYDALSPEDPYPLIVDNALTRYDDDRLKITVDLLKEKAKERQVIITTSDTRVLNLVPKRSVKELQSP